VPQTVKSHSLQDGRPATNIQIIIAHSAEDYITEFLFICGVSDLWNCSNILVNSSNSKFKLIPSIKIQEQVATTVQLKKVLPSKY
jgi:hypothetical protein